MSRVAPVLMAILLIAGCATTASTVAPAGGGIAALPRTVSVTDAAALRDDGAFVLDVREPDEWAGGHIPGASLIPLGQLAGRLGEIDRDQPIVVVCRSGNRSASGRDILLDAGFPAVTSLEGGMTDWIQAGMATETGG